MYNVLLVDDEPLAIEGLEWFIDWKALGFRICGTCENGNEALAKIRELNPDVVVTDVRMPVLDGLELIGAVRGIGSRTPEFVILSGYNEFSYARKALQLGVRHYMLKPIIEEEATAVMREVRSRLERRESQGTATLLEVATPQINHLLEAIERSDPDMADNRIRAILRDAERRNGSEEEMRLLANHLAYRMIRYVRETVDSSEPFEAGLDDEQPLPCTVDALSELAARAVGAVRAFRARRTGGTLAEVDRYIAQNYRETLSVKKVAALHYLNPVYLGRAYHAKYGRTVLDRMHDLRIDEAATLLGRTDDPAALIAERVGYGQYNHFLRQFERRYGMKPSAYRESLRLKNELS